MLDIIARKNLLLQSHMDIIRVKSIREKVLKYLGPFVYEQGRTFTIPLSREEMADFLCVNRSALSHELIRMKHDGILEYKRNTFTLL